MESILDAKPSKLLTCYLDYCEEAGADRSVVKDTAERTVLHIKSGSPPADLGEVTERRWYGSLESGKPDWSVYFGDYYLAEAWACWAVYSRQYLKRLCEPGHLKDTHESAVSAMGEVKSVLDLGCGAGITTAALTQLFPGADVVGTNLDGTTQAEVSRRYGKAYGFNVCASPTGEADVVFASEYFEHIVSPIVHLREVLEVSQPTFFIFANTFNQKAVGHFPCYSVDGGWVAGSKLPRMFGAELKRRRFRKVRTKFWNGRPSIWVRVRE